MCKKYLNDSLNRLEKLVSTKNSEIESIGIKEQKAEVEREIRMRQSIYSKMVACNKMTPGEKTKKINTMLAVLRTLEDLSNNLKSA